MIVHLIYFILIMFAKEASLGSVSMWSANLKDFKSLCGEKMCYLKDNSTPPAHYGNNSTSSDLSTTSSKFTKHMWSTQSKLTPQFTAPAALERVTPSRALEHCTAGSFYPHEHCGSFYVCVNGQLVTQSCGSGLRWNAESAICDWSYKVKCSDRKQLALKTQKLIKESDDVPHQPNSRCQAGSFSAYEGDCTQYLLCLWNKYETFQCSEGLHWNNDKKICDWPEHAHCTEGSSSEVVNDEKGETERTTTETVYKPTKPLHEWSSSPSPIPTTTGISYKPTKPPHEWSSSSSSPTPATTGISYKPTKLPLEWSSASSSTNATTTGISYKPTKPPHEWSSLSSLTPTTTGISYEPTKPSHEWSSASSLTVPTITEISYKPKKPPHEWSSTSPTTPTTPGITYKSTKPPHERSSSSAKPTPPTTSVEVPSEPLSGYYKIVCYFTNWAWYRKGIGKYVPEDIDPNLCTHIVYAFVVLDYENLTVRAHDSWSDFDNNFFSRVTAYKKKGLKVSLALGGWNDSMGDKYSRLVNNPAARARFIKHVLEYLEKYNFDGLDVDWEYPKCWQVECDKGLDSDKPAFATFMAELKEAFRPKGYLLSSAASPNKNVIDAGYDVSALAKNLDWIAVTAYDYHGQWDKQTGHIAPLYFHPEDKIAYFNANFSINYWISKGVPRRKIVMGIPFFGQSFQLKDMANHGLNANAPGPGQAGEFTRAAGFLGYHEICDRIKNKDWTVVQEPKRRMGPYAYKDNQWVSYDDKEIIRLKSEYIRKMDLGGAMVWALDLDDFKNRCGDGRHPLLNTIRRVLAAPGTEVTEIPNATPEPEEAESSQHTRTHPSESVPCIGQLYVPHEQNCNQYYLCTTKEKLVLQTCPNGLLWNIDHCDRPENTDCRPDANTLSLSSTTENHKPLLPHTSDAPLTETISTPSRSNATVQPGADDYKVVCYFTNWAWSRKGIGKYVPDDIDPSLCTHINYGFAELDPNSLTIKPNDSSIDNEFYKKVTSYKSYGIKVLIALGGWEESHGNKYSRLVNDPLARARFVDHVVQFIEKWGFDGLDFDWEYPKCWQGDCNEGADLEKQNFATLVADLSAAFKPKGWLLSAAVSPNKKIIDAGYDVPSLNQHLDWIAVMTYDFHGHWEEQTGHVAPLYYYPGDVHDNFNTNFSLHYWMEMGASPSKLIMGMPFYGRTFTLADASNKELNARASGPGEAGEYTKAEEFLAFYEICERVKQRSWSVTRDPQGRVGPYAVNGNQWVSYDDIAEIRRKSRLVKQLGLGGGMFWALDLDDFRNTCGCGKHPLLKTMNNELRGVPLDDNLENCT